MRSNERAVHLVQAVQERIRAGQTTPEIVRGLHVQDRFVHQVAREMGCLRRGRPASGVSSATLKLMAKAAKLRAAGVKATEIAKRLHRTESRVYDLLRLAKERDKHA